MALPNPNLPPEWLQALAILQQRQQEQLAAQQGGLTQAAALQAEPQAGFDNRFAGLEEAMAAAQAQQVQPDQAQQALPDQAQQPPVLPLASFADQMLGTRPYETGRITPITERVPWLNAAGRAIKRTPVLGDMVGGLADLASTAGSSQYQPRDSLAAAVDLLPVAGLALKGAAMTGRPILQAAQRGYNRLPIMKGKAPVEGAVNVVPFNPWERSGDDPIYPQYK